MRFLATRHELSDEFNAPESPEGTPRKWHLRSTDVAVDGNGDIFLVAVWEIDL